MKEFEMKTTLRTGALVTALIATTALTAAPAMADRDHHDYGGKSWNQSRNDKSWNERYIYDHHRQHHDHDYDRNEYGWYRGHAYWPYVYGIPGVTITIR
jgi:hypothetical protein